MAEKVDFADLELSRKRLGAGAGGEVRMAKWKDQEIAVKVCEFLTNSLKKNAEREITHLSKINHENVIKVFGTASDDDTNTNYLLMEYLEEGSLHDFLYADNQREYTVEQAVRWAFQCAKGLAHLHSMERPVFHRDIKPQNLLLTNQFENLKICDFGLATDMSNNKSDMRGTPRYMAPEVFKDKKYTDKCDVYSLGIVIWEIMSRKRPYFHLENPENEFAILSAVEMGERPKMDAVRSDCWNGIKHLIECCVDPDPDRRPSMQRIEEYLGDVCVGGQYEDFVHILDDDSVAVVTFHKDASGNRRIMRVDLLRRHWRTVRMTFPIVQREAERLGKVIARETVRAAGDVATETARAAHDGERETRRAERDTEREVSRAAHDGERETRRAAQDVGRETGRAFNKLKKKLRF
ncbi:putative mitogen-activated protein kinase kinase kinase 7-like isoform X1 [Drosophila gunungcola]|uniref:Protein kinase domain-containing protein n=1 Tax=Drosophila gunungcola TaxID=103775 RepID=A0A9P9Z0L8_9MUSC|nr:putative mitogen-activated protein kinase kinase kinase 7-like isoform X1 [Drosophila gunungcola]KAI8046585.1 hypothetical protein M5D96_002796 [Drosophila gunungcola]